jgi:hypothetical protein
MTEPGTHSSKTVTVDPNTSAGSITIGGQDSGQTIDFSPTPWTPEESEHYARTGETPLARLHRENLTAQLGTQA